MATNQLLPFANGDVPNVLPYDEWNSLPARLTGFQSGIASSQQFNYILAQGGAAGYVLGQLVVDFAGQDATLDAASLYTNFKRAVASCSVPPGTIIAFAGQEIPEGFLLCNGAAVSRSTYAGLFSAIGTTYGTGDGVSTFNLPSTDGRVLQGTGSSSSVGQTLNAALPAISGTFPAGNSGDRNFSGSVHFSGSASDKYLGGTTDTQFNFALAALNATGSSALYSGSVLQPNAIVTQFLIKF